MKIYPLDLGMPRFFIKKQNTAPLTPPQKNNIETIIIPVFEKILGNFQPDIVKNTYGTTVTKPPPKVQVIIFTIHSLLAKKYSGKPITKTTMMDNKKPIV